MLKNIVLEAKEIWYKEDCAAKEAVWLLRGANLQNPEGDFIAILGDSETGTVLLKVLSFRLLPTKGTVYFEGRLVGRNGIEEIVQMQRERVWYLKGTINNSQLRLERHQRLAAVLLDEPLIEDEAALAALLAQIVNLNQAGVAVLVASQEPGLAAQASEIYKLVDGKLKKLT